MPNMEKFVIETNEKHNNLVAIHNPSIFGYPISLQMGAILGRNIGRSDELETLVLPNKTISEIKLNYDFNPDYNINRELEIASLQGFAHIYEFAKKISAPVDLAFKKENAPDSDTIEELHSLFWKVHKAFSEAIDLGSRYIIAMSDLASTDTAINEKIVMELPFITSNISRLSSVQNDLPAYIDLMHHCIHDYRNSKG